MSRILFLWPSACCFGGHYFACQLCCAHGHPAAVLCLTRIRPDLCSGASPFYNSLFAGRCDRSTNSKHIVDLPVYVTTSPCPLLLSSSSVFLSVFVFVFLIFVFFKKSSCPSLFSSLLNVLPTCQIKCSSSCRECLQSAHVTHLHDQINSLNKRKTTKLPVRQLDSKHGSHFKEHTHLTTTSGSGHLAAATTTTSSATSLLVLRLLLTTSSVGHEPFAASYKLFGRSTSSKL